MGLVALILFEQRSVPLPAISPSTDPSTPVAAVGAPIVRPGSSSVCPVDATHDLHLARRVASLDNRTSPQREQTAQGNQLAIMRQT